MTIEGVLLTGGASRRMGIEKASLMIHGLPLGDRIASELAICCDPVTVLGRSPMSGYRFLEDSEDNQGPLVALSRFAPVRECVFIASCDLPLFSSSIVGDLAANLGSRSAVFPIWEDRKQPLCALYRADAFASLRELVAAGESRMMRWADSLDATTVSANLLRVPLGVANVNTPEELEVLLSRSAP